MNFTKPRRHVPAPAEPTRLDIREYLIAAKVITKPAPPRPAPEPRESKREHEYPTLITSNLELATLSEYGAYMRARRKRGGDV